MRRWTLIALIVLFAGLGVAAAFQFTLGRHKQVQCPGPHATFGGPHAIAKCVTPSPSPT